MSPPLLYDEAAILAIVQRWPPARQIRFVQEVLRALTPEDAANRFAGLTLSLAQGLLKTDRPPPSDAEVRQWLEDDRWERLG